MNKKKEYTFEEIIKHASDIYNDYKHDWGKCPLCNHYHDITNKYDFSGLLKTWDYDD